MGAKLNNESVVLDFPSRIYSAEAVRLAGYVFLERCRMKAKYGKGCSSVQIFGGSAAELAGPFCNEVLNQQCRIDLAAQNSKLANMIVTRALLSALGSREKKGS